MIETQTISEAALVLLQAINQAGGALSVTLPARQITTAGTAVHDCESVIVSVTTALPGGLVNATGSPGSADVGYCDPLWQVTVEASVIRTAQEAPGGPRGELPPDPGLMAADLLSASKDAAVLARAVEIATSQINGMPFREGMVWGSPSVSIALAPPSGGLRAVTMTLQVNV